MGNRNNIHKKLLHKMDIVFGLNKMINSNNLLFGQEFILGQLIVIIKKILMQEPFCSYGSKCMRNIREKCSTVQNYADESLIYLQKKMGSVFYFLDSTNLSKNFKFMFLNRYKILRRINKHLME